MKEWLIAFFVSIAIVVVVAIFIVIIQTIYILGWLMPAMLTFIFVLFVVVIKIALDSNSYS